MKGTARFAIWGLALALGGASWAQVLRIGVVGPMAFVQGEHTWYGATLAAEELNRAGGVLVGNQRYRIELVRVDTNEMTSVTDAATAVERAITAQRVDFLIGGFRSEAVLAMTEVAADYKKPFLITGAGLDGILAGRVDRNYERFKYLFRVSPNKSSDLARTSLLLLGEVVQAVRRDLRIERPKVAILAERAAWADPLVETATRLIAAPPPQGYRAEVAGTWRPSATATDVTPELTAIQRAGAQVIFTVLSGPVGVPFGRDWGRLKIPAAAVGINVEAQQETWLKATDNLGAYVATLNTLAPAVAITPKTIPFISSFQARFKQFPIYTASGAYGALYILAEALNRAGTTAADAVVRALEATDYTGPAGRIVFDKTHDVIWGPGYTTGLGVQWIGGRMQAFWPRQWRVGNQTVSYAGVQPYQLPPWVVEAWRR
uniref:ABC transporter substrate-binding protein n=1 Tax=Thermus caliditerrae TaxID=1330700 RepID=A0A7C5REK3_9DEIN